MGAYFCVPTIYSIEYIMSTFQVTQKLMQRLPVRTGARSKNGVHPLLISHEAKLPDAHPSAYVAPNATICGNIKIGGNRKVMHGDSIITKGGRTTIGHHCMILTTYHSKQTE